MRYLILALFVLTGCAEAKSGSRAAVIIPSPMNGYVCFGVQNDSGEIVGGSCVRD